MVLILKSASPPNPAARRLADTIRHRDSAFGPPIVLAAVDPCHNCLILQLGIVRRMKHTAERPLRDRYPRFRILFAVWTVLGLFSYARYFMLTGRDHQLAFATCATG